MHKITNSSKLKDVTEGVKNDLKRWNREIQCNSMSTANFIQLRTTNPCHSSLNFLIDWLTIVACYEVSINNYFLLPICLLVAGSRMRALSNLIHDASHSNITRNTRLNDFIANLLAGMPLASPVNEYRRSHILHHKNLSHPTLDPDMQTHHRYGYSETYPPHREWYLNILFIVFNFEAWKDSLFGSWHEANRKNKVFICIWWIVGLSILALTSPKQILTFIIFWLLTRSTGYHFVRIIAEFLDHSGLPVGSIRKNCRDLSSSNFVLKYLFHPHNDCFHALHHFEPRIPTHQLKKAHAFAKDHIPIYKEVRKNSGYLLGSAPALSEVGSL